MSGHAHTPRAASERRLTDAELADLLRLALQQCGRTDMPPKSLPDLMTLVAARRGRVVSDEELWQVAEAVALAGKLSLLTNIGAHDPLLMVDAAVRAANVPPPVALHALVAEAWVVYEPASLSADATPELPSEEDLERADLERLTLAGRYFLLAHKDGGELLVAEPVCALGLAGSLLAELVLAGLVRYAPATSMLTARADAAAPKSVSPVAGEIATRLRQPCPVRRALDHVAADAYVRVRDLLLDAGILTSRKPRQLLPFASRRTLFAPARPRLAERVFNAVAALPTTQASRLDLQDAALIELARATGITAAAGRQWWMARDIPAEEAAAARNPGLSHLMGQVAAVVTTTVALRQR